MKIKIVFLLFFLSSTAILLYHNVETSPQAEDIKYIQLILNSNEHKDYSISSYEEQIKIIKLIQDQVLNHTNDKNIAIELNKTREPKDIYQLKKGSCHDRSRFIEKALEYYGFKVRHLFLLKNKNNSWLNILKRGHPSHSVTEVFTKKGWLVVESNYRWLSLDKNESPIPSDKIHQAYTENKLLADPPEPIFKDKFIIIPGLYSRHGKFFPPFTPIPDYNLNTLIGF